MAVRAGIFPPMSTFDDVGVIIHVLRVIRGLSQGDLAQLSGVRNSSISNYERGKSVPKLETLEKLGQGLELPISAMEEAQEFIRRMRSRGQGGANPSQLSFSGLDSQGGFPPKDSALLHRELDRLASEAGRVLYETLRVVLGMLPGASDARSAESIEAGGAADDNP